MDMPIPPLPPEQVTNGQLYAALMSVAHSVSDVSRKVDGVAAENMQLRREFEQYKTNTKGMLDTWTTARGTMAFIRWMAIIGFPVGGLIAFLQSSRG